MELDAFVCFGCSPSGQHSLARYSCWDYVVVFSKMSIEGISKSDDRADSWDDGRSLYERSRYVPFFPDWDLG